MNSSLGLLFLRVSHVGGARWAWAVVRGGCAPLFVWCRYTASACWLVLMLLSFILHSSACRGLDEADRLHLPFSPLPGTASYRLDTVTLERETLLAEAPGGLLRDVSDGSLRASIVRGVWLVNQVSGGVFDSVCCLLGGLSVVRRPLFSVLNRGAYRLFPLLSVASRCFFWRGGHATTNV